MSEELKLTAAEEKKFTEVVKSLNQRKAELGQRLQDSVDRMAKETIEKAKSAQLNDYKKNLRSYNQLSEEEVEKIQKLLGVDKTIQYLQIKQDLINRIKSMLSSSEVKKRALPTPKIIEEK